MAETCFIIILICFITISLTNSYNINDRILDNIDDDQSNWSFDRTTISPPFHSNIPQCIAVQAIKEFGCTLTSTNVLFQGLFESACERHHLCYSCGFVHGITAQQCNRLAYRHMYKICSDHNASLTFKSECLTTRFLALHLLRTRIYRSANNSDEFPIDCHQKCVYDYLYAS